MREATIKSSHDIILQDVSEKDWSCQVEELFDLYGWIWTHFRPGLTNKGWRTPLSGRPGFPDYFAARMEPDEGKIRLLLVELKSENGKLTKSQEIWKDLLLRSAIPVHLWKPSMIDEIIAILGGKP